MNENNDSGNFLLIEIPKRKQIKLSVYLGQIRIQDNLGRTASISPNFLLDIVIAESKKGSVTYTFDK